MTENTVKKLITIKPSNIKKGCETAKRLFKDDKNKSFSRYVTELIENDKR